MKRKRRTNQEKKTFHFVCRASNKIKYALCVLQVVYGCCIRLWGVCLCVCMSAGAYLQNRCSIVFVCAIVCVFISIVWQFSMPLPLSMLLSSWFFVFFYSFTHWICNVRYFTAITCILWRRNYKSIKIVYNCAFCLMRTAANDTQRICVVYKTICDTCNGRDVRER